VTTDSGQTRRAGHRDEEPAASRRDRRRHWRAPCRPDARAGVDAAGAGRRTDGSQRSTAGADDHPDDPAHHDTFANDDVSGDDIDDQPSDDLDNGRTVDHHHAHGVDDPDDKHGDDDHAAHDPPAHDDHAAHDPPGYDPPAHVLDRGDGGPSCCGACRGAALRRCGGDDHGLAESRLDPGNGQR
jgi:hypothetical protein